MPFKPFTGGDPITSGTRYIIAAFLYLDEIKNGVDEVHAPQPSKAAIQKPFKWNGDAGAAFTFEFGEADQ